MTETFEHTEEREAEVAPAAVWRLWSDPATWSDWDPAVEAVDLPDGVVSGSVGTMRLMGGIEVPVSVDIVENGARYVDRLTMGELSIVIDHRVQARGTGSAIVVHTEITGPGAEQIGPMVTNDAPVALERLVAAAE